MNKMVFQKISGYLLIVIGVLIVVFGGGGATAALLIVPFGVYLALTKHDFIIGSEVERKDFSKYRTSK